MLALTRKKGESIIVNNEVEIVILSIHGEQVKIGIVADKSIPVHRKEVYEQIKLENLEAAKAKNVKIGDIKELLK